MSLHDQIRLKAKRKLPLVYRDLIAGKNPFPWTVPLNRDSLGEDLILWREEMNSLRKIDKAHSGQLGPIVHSKTVKTRKFGEQIFPDKVIFESVEDLVGFLNATTDYSRLLALVAQTRTIPEMEPWLLKPTSPKRLLEYEKIWDQVLEVCQYFLVRNDFKLLPKLFPISVHSKFIEENRGLLSEIFGLVLPLDRVNSSGKTFEERYKIATVESRIRFRIPNKDLQKELDSAFSEIEAPLSEVVEYFEGLHKEIPFFIVENKTNLLSFPAEFQGIVIFGSGFLVGAFKRYKFLERNQLFYWGDIDAHGFEILAIVKEQFRQAQAFLMSEEILNNHWQGTRGCASDRRGKPVSLSKEELALYIKIKNGEKRLEQEKIPLSVIEEGLRELGLD